MRHLLDLDRFPLDRRDSPPGRRLLDRCRRDLRETGMFSLPELIRTEALAGSVADLEPLFETAAFTHCREHNIYFDDAIREVAPDHPALRRFGTVNHTVCADQIAGSAISQIYGWRPLIGFLAAALGKPRLYPMADPLARINVMAYGAGEQLNWHFDRAEFTTTCLLQAPVAGGTFQYRRDLRSDTDPNYDGVDRLLAGWDGLVRSLPLAPGTLNVFKGKNTAHRVTPVEGDRARIVAVFSYFEEPGVSFTESERLGFYGRTGP